MKFSKPKKILAAVLSVSLVISANIFAVNAANSKPNNSNVAYGEYQTEYFKFDDIFDIHTIPNKLSKNPGFSVFGFIEPKKFTGDKFYNELDKNSKDIYNELYNSFKEGFGDTVDISNKGLTYKESQIKADLVNYLSQKEFKVTFNNEKKLSNESALEIGNSIKSSVYPGSLAMAMDHPELSWMSFLSFGYRYRYSYDTTPDNDGKYALTLTEVTFNVSSQNVYGTKDDMAAAVNKIKTEIGTADTRYDQLKKIHDYLCNTITYNDKAANEQSSSTYDTGWYQTAYSAFYPIDQDKNGGNNQYTEGQKLTVCAGYARGLKVLCDSYGIPCIVVRGLGNGGAHAWNYVQMEDGKWYGVDATWNDQVTYISDKYFLVGTNSVGFHGKTFGTDHEPKGLWYNASEGATTFEFVYPELAEDAFDPDKPIVTTTTEPAPIVTTTTTTEPAPIVTTTTTTEPAPIVTTTTTTEPAPIVTTTTTTEPAPVVTTTPEATTSATAAPIATTAPEVTTNGSQSGTVEDKVNVGENAPKAEISMDKKDLIDAVLSDEEKKAVENGTDVKIALNINVNGNVDAADKATIEKAANGLTIGAYLNIDLIKTISDKETKVTNTNKAVVVTITIPADLVKAGREFSVIRLHNGTADILKDTDNSDETATFETDKFSIYALAYSDKADDGQKPTGSSIGGVQIMLVFISAVAVTSASTVFVSKKKNSKK